MILLVPCTLSFAASCTVLSLEMAETQHLSVELERVLAGTLGEEGVFHRSDSALFERRRVEYVISFELLQDILGFFVYEYQLRQLQYGFRSSEDLWQ